MGLCCACFFVVKVKNSKRWSSWDTFFWARQPFSCARFLVQWNEDLKENLVDTIFSSKLIFLLKIHLFYFTQIVDSPKNSQMDFSLIPTPLKSTINRTPFPTSQSPFFTGWDLILTWPTNKYFRNQRLPAVLVSGTLIHLILILHAPSVLLLQVLYCIMQCLGWVKVP